MTAGSAPASRPTSEVNLSADLDRRRFLAACASAGALACLGAGPGCTVPPRSFAAPPAVRKAVRVPLARYPELERPGGVVKVLTREADAVFLRREADGRFTALSGICTHQGCTVATAGDGFRCPCHGSTYDGAGQVTGGPARQALERYPAALDGDAVAIVLIPESRR